MSRHLTQQQMDDLQVAFDVLNAELFGGTLPQVLIVIHRHKGAHGYFRPHAFVDKSSPDPEVINEIALNPETFYRPDEIILSTLAHEMCHLWQHVSGKPSRKAYHNKEWAMRMTAIGLIPSDTGAPGGKQTGQKVSHYIDDAGPFLPVARSLVENGISLRWVAYAGGAAPKAKNTGKLKWECPECGQACWGKATLRVVCAECEVPLVCVEPPEGEDDDEL